MKRTAASKSISRVSPSPVSPIASSAFGHDYHFLCAFIRSCDGWEQVEDFGEAKYDCFTIFLALPHGIPPMIPSAVCIPSSIPWSFRNRSRTGCAAFRTPPGERWCRLMGRHRGVPMIAVRVKRPSMRAKCDCPANEAALKLPRPANRAIIPLICLAILTCPRAGHNMTIHRRRSGRAAGIAARFARAGLGRSVSGVERG